MTSLRLESMVAKASATVLRSTPAMTRDPHSQSSLMLSVPFYRISGLSMELGSNPGSAMTAYQMHEMRTDRNSIWSRRVQGVFFVL